MLFHLRVHIHCILNSVVWLFVLACASEQKELGGESLTPTLHEEIERLGTLSPCLELEEGQANIWVERERRLYLLHQERAQVQSSSLLPALQSVRRLTDCGGALGEEWKLEYNQWVAWRREMEHLLAQKVQLWEMRRSLAQKEKDLRSLREVDKEIQELLRGTRRNL